MAFDEEISRISVTPSVCGSATCLAGPILIPLQYIHSDIHIDNSGCYIVTIDVTTTAEAPAHIQSLYVITTIPRSADIASEGVESLR